MQIAQTTLGDATVLSPSGRMDAEWVTEFENTCVNVVMAGKRVLIMNFNTLSYLSSVGLRAILNVGKILKERGGLLVLVAEPGPIRQIIEIAGFHKVFTMCASLAEAERFGHGGCEIRVSKDWSVDVITIRGRLDAEKAPELEKKGREVLEQNYQKLVIDASEVEYLSSAGLCALLNLRKLAQERHSRVFICGPSSTVKQVLQISGFDKLFVIRASVEEALVD
jgi:anti-anti-sigma factor